MMRIRPERPDDIAAIRAVNEAAFEQTIEADIVDALRTACLHVLSLVADSGGEVVGHILCSLVAVDGGARTMQGMGLAPMAVLPERQRQGIGSELVEAGLEILRERNCPFVIILGRPEFYPRFGFVPASCHGITCQWEGLPDAAFMVLMLDASSMAGVTGTARYREELDAAM